MPARQDLVRHNYAAKPPTLQLHPQTCSDRPSPLTKGNQISRGTCFDLPQLLTAKRAKDTIVSAENTGLDCSDSFDCTILSSTHQRIQQTGYRTNNMQSLFHRPGVADGAGGEESGNGGGDNSANQIDEFRAIVEELRKENPNRSITAIRQMAIKKMTQDRLTWGAANNNASGLQADQHQYGAAHIANESLRQSNYGGHAKPFRATTDDRPGGDRRRRSSGDLAQSIMDAVCKVGQDAIKNIQQGGELEEEIPESRRVLMRRSSMNHVVSRHNDRDESSE